MRLNEALKQEFSEITRNKTKPKQNDPKLGFFQVLLRFLLKLLSSENMFELIDYNYKNMPLVSIFDP